MRRVLVGLLVVTTVTFGIWRMAALTVSVGSAQIALVQIGAVAVTDWGAGFMGAVSASLPAPSMPGTAIVAVLSNSGNFGALTVGQMPSGWTKFISQTEGATSDIEVWLYLNNPGGIQVLTFTAAGGTGTWLVHLSEWSNVAFANPVDASGSASSTAGTTLTPSTTAAASTNGDIALTSWMQRAAGAVTFTSPTGFTRLIDNGSDATHTVHLDVEYQLNPTTASPLGPILTSTGTTASAVGATLILKAAHTVVDETAYLAHDGVSLKLNTADFSLMLGGHLQMEGGLGDQSAYLLEDGSGYYLLDSYAPSLGDPVAFTNPTWSGRVVSVNKSDIVDRLSNYAFVTLAATNTAAASASPAAPGDFSDVPSGGYLLLEDASGKYLLEDSTGYLELEGTSYGYRHLSVRSSQNQDGTITTYGTLETFEPGYASGQAILLTSANLGYTAQGFTITNVTTSFIGANPPTPIYVVEFGDAYQTLQRAGGGVLTQQGSQAVIQQGVAMPGGVLGYAPVTGAQAGITTIVDLAGLAVTVSVASGRRIRISGTVEVSSTVATDVAELYIYEGAAQLQAAVTHLNALQDKALPISLILQPSAGVHVYNLRMQRAAGTGTLTMDAAASFPAYIICEDIGT